MRVTLTQFQPFRSSELFEERVHRLSSEASDRSSDEAILTPWAPAVDIFENGQELVVKTDVPDVQPAELDIRVANNILTIRGERKFAKQGDNGNYLRVERSHGSFRRSFSLGNTVKTEAIPAHYQCGVLTLRLPKREEAKPKQIEGSTAGSGLSEPSGDRGNAGNAAVR